VPLQTLEMHVEGKNDAHVIRNLLCLHQGPGYDFAKPPNGWPAYKYLLDGTELGVERLISIIDPVIKAGSDPPSIHGFVIDADKSLKNRWEAVRNKLIVAGVEPPKKMPPDGFVGESGDGCRVGAWLMPDNKEPGELESFLVSLIPKSDVILAHAESATIQARHLDAPFKEVDTEKAVIHTWLAWQDEPGYPYGKAITSRFFAHNAIAAQQFVAWFKLLYQINEAT
jgi:hypothetical protein